MTTPLPDPIAGRPFAHVDTDTLETLLDKHKPDDRGRCTGDHNINMPRPRWRDCLLGNLAAAELNHRQQGDIR